MICDAKKICALISRAQKIAIVCHANPDGDTLGSGLALFRTLRALCKDVSIFCSDAPAGKLTALNGAELVRTDVPKEAFDLAVAVDCSDINLLFRHANLIRHARTSACVDHHVSNNDYADFTYVERGVAAAAQPIYKLIRLLLPRQKLDMQTAELLYTALVTDSGGFAFSSVTGETMRIAADLLDAGVRGDKIIEFFMHDVTMPVFKLKTRVLAGAEFFADGKIGVITFSKEDFDATGTSVADTTGVINSVREIEGVHIAVALTEAGREEFKVSIRSNEHACANRIAAVFGGGGHDRAAGCRVFGIYEDVKERVLKACRDHLE